MGESTVADVDKMVTTDGDEQQRPQLPISQDFEAAEVLKGQRILELQKVDTDIERLQILESATAEDLIDTRALAKKFVDHVAGTDQMAAMGAIQRKVQMHKAYIESMLARQKAELENFDKIRGDLITSVVIQVQDTLEAVLEDSSVGAELKDQLMTSLREKLQTIELDVEIKAKT